MAKTVKYLLVHPYYAEDGSVVQPGELYDSEGQAPEGAVVKEVIHDDAAPEPAWHPVNVPESAWAEQVAAAEAAAPAPEPKAAEHRSAGGKAGGKP
jgi:hypothetical protein